MRHTLLVLLVALAPANPCLAQIEDSEALKDLARKSRASVALLKVFATGGRQVGSGTGFFVEGNRLVTNQHVIDQAARIEAVLADGVEVEVLGLVAADEVDDLAILEVDGGPFPVLTLADSASIEAGERIVVFGSPLGLSGSLSEGIVSAVRERGLAEDVPGASDAPLLQITAAISPGSSGSPVMTRDGRVIGVAVSQAVYGQNLNFAVPSAAVATLLEQAAGQPLQRDFRSRRIFGGAYLRNVLISLVLFAALYLTFKYWT